MVLDIPGKLLGQSDVRETPSGTSSSSSSSTIIAPIGSLLPWLKSYTNTPQALPTGWVEADGSVINDADSVYDGQTLPDLNGGEFLRGAATSGGAGGSDTMAHTHTGTASGTTGSHTLTIAEMPAHTHSTSNLLKNTGLETDLVTSGSAGSRVTQQGSITSASTGGGSGHTHSFSDGFTTSAASNAENRPLYYNVVWIIRIK